MQTRPATPRDFAAVESIFRQAITTAQWLPPERRRPAALADATEGERVVVCVDERDAVLGFISVWEEEAFIHHLYVSPAHARKGVGTRLVESLRQWLPFPWALKCVVVNADALAFYQARGFAVVEVHQDDHPPHALMERRE